MKNYEYLLESYYNGSITKKDLQNPRTLESLIEDGVYNEETSRLRINNSFTEIGDSAFEDWAVEGNEPYVLRLVEIYSNVSRIGPRAFAKCDELKEVKFSENSKLTKIERETFCECLSLEDINIPNSVTEIDEGAFFDCISLEEIVIPGNVSKIGPSAFAGCEKLKKILIIDPECEIADNAFIGCPGTVQVGFNESKSRYTTFKYNFNK